MTRRSETRFAYWVMPAHSAGLSGYPDAVINVPLSAPTENPELPPSIAQYVSPIPHFDAMRKPPTGRTSGLGRGAEQPVDGRLASVAEQLADRVSPGSRIDVKDVADNVAARRREMPSFATIVKRDRFGFRWERVVSLSDYVGLDDAARLLGLSHMSLNRYVKNGMLRSRKAARSPERTLGKKKEGASKKKSNASLAYQVVRVADVWRLAQSLELRVPAGKSIIVVGTGENSDE